MGDDRRGIGDEWGPRSWSPRLSAPAGRSITAGTVDCRTGTPAGTRPRPHPERLSPDDS